MRDMTAMTQSRPPAFAIATVALAFVLAGLGAYPSPASTEPFQPVFAGTVSIANKPADPGTVVQVAVFRASRKYTVCADTTVQMHKTGAPPGGVPNVTAYMARLKNTPQCLNPANEYDLYVNGVHARHVGYVFSPNAEISYQNLVVPEAALRTKPEQSGVRLVWFFGSVRDQIGRPVPDGTVVTVDARGATCHGTGKTQDLYWVPKAPNIQPVGKLGFYVVGVEMTNDCADSLIDFRVYAGAAPLQEIDRSVLTPPYAQAVEQNLLLDSRS